MEIDEPGPAEEGRIKEVAAETPQPSNAGALLAEARKKLGMSIFEVSDRLHLTEYYVRALEANDYSNLPGEVFVKGYLKNYALLVGLDPAEVSGSWHESSAPGEAAREPARKQPAKFSQNWFLLLIILILIVVIGAGGWWAWQIFGASFGLVPGARAKDRHDEAPEP